MKKGKMLIRCFGIFIGLLAILWLFMILSASIPNSFLKKNMVKSALTITQADTFAYCEGNKLSGIADNYADSIWLNVAWYMGKGNPYFSSIDTKYYDGEDKGERAGLYLAVTEESQEANTDYTRYWHGTAAVIRIFHLFTDLNGVRMTGFVVTLGLAAAVMILLIRDGKDWVAICFFLSLCMIKIWNVRLSMEYQPAFMIGFLMCILYLLFEKKGDECLSLLSVMGGTLIAFFDFLTTETVVILLPLILVVAVRGMDHRIESFNKSMILIIVQGMGWLGAYVMTIFVKWCLASVLTGTNKFVSAFNSAGERISGSNPGTGELSFLMQKLAAPAANLSGLFGGRERLSGISFVLGILFLVLFAVISFVALRFGNKENRAETKILILLGSGILVRYLVLNNHSYIHAFFTYRGMMSMIMALFSIILLNKKKLY